MGTGVAAAENQHSSLLVLTCRGDLRSALGGQQAVDDTKMESEQAAAAEGDEAAVEPELVRKGGG